MEFYAESALHFQPNRPEPLRGYDAIREDYLKSTFIPFPDVKIEKVRAFGKGNWICIEMIMTGTHTGPLGEGDEVIPPTNKSIRVPICIVAKVEDGKITESHEYNDQLGFLAQLGL